jgi:hypothetical protein
MAVTWRESRVSRARASRIRRQLRQTEEARRELVDQLVGTESFIVGALLAHTRRCGKPTCHCVTGEKHAYKALSRSEDGRVRMIYVPACDEVDVAAETERYRRFRQARAELVKLAAQTVALADELQVEVAKPYPPPNRAPGRQRRRKSRGGRKS